MSHPTYTCSCAHHSNNAFQYRSAQELTAHLEVVRRLPALTSYTFLGRNLLETPALKHYGLAINTEHRLLLCLSCMVAVVPSQLKSHLSKHLLIKLNDEDRQAITHLLTLCGVDLTTLPDLSKSILVFEIEGLPLHQAHSCPSCSGVYFTYEALKAHMRQKHRGVTYPSANATVFAQRLKLQGSHSQGILVDVSEEPPSKFSDEDILMQAEALMNAPTAESSIQPSSDPRDFCPWLRLVRWQDLTVSKDIHGLVALVAHPRSDEFTSLSDGLNHLLRLASSKFECTSELILQRLHTPKPTDEVKSRPFMPLQNHDDQLKRYCLPVLGLVAMVLRGCPVPVKAEIHLATDRLKSSLSSQNAQTIGDRILCLLSLLWQQSWPPLVNHRISDPTIIYLALSSLEVTGKFKSAKDITSVIAKLEYCMRLVFLLLINQHETSHESGYQAYQPFFKEGQETTFNSLRTAQRQASSIAYLTQGLPKVWWYDRKRYRELIYKGTHIHIEQLHALLAALETRMKELWEEDVLLGLGLRVPYGELCDDLSSTDVGYSFWTDERNANTFSDKHWLLRAILANKTLSSRFVSLNQSGVLRFNVHAGRAWLNQHARFHKLMLLRFYMTGGSPARGTEMSAMVLKNTATYPLRNLVAFGSFISLLCTYQKTSSLSGHDKLIPHALDAFTSDLLIQELVIARPFSILMATVCYPDTATVKDLLSKHVFVNNDKLFETTDVTDILQQFSAEFLGIELGVSDWRHISSAFRRKLCSRLQDLIDDDDENETIEALQMGHTRKTDNRVYGVSQEALQGAPEDILPLFLDASTDWQIVCRVVPGGLSLPYDEALMSSFSTHVKNGLISLDTHQSEDQNHWLADHLHRTDERLRSLEEQCRRIADSLQAVLEVGSNKSNFLDRRSSSQSILVSEASQSDSGASSSLFALRTLLKKPDASWKSDGQQAAVAAVLEQKHDVVAILPTNAGKSMVAIIPPFLEKGLVTVVILPLRILVMDFQRKLEAMGVSFHTYDSNKNRIQLSSGCNLILVSADQVQWDAWKQAIVILHQQRPVVRQIIDEAHIPLLSQEFRHALQHMADIRCSIPLQIVLLTASGHEELLAAMRIQYAIEDNAVIIRESSNRPELKYVWRTIDCIDSTDALVEAIAATIKENLLEKRDRGVVFVPWKELGEDLACRLKYPFYCGSNPDNPGIYQSWLAGSPPVVVATSAFGTGNDYPHVKAVIHACAPYDMVNYVQEVSRAGRDGSPALCLLLDLSGPNVRSARANTDGADLSGRLVISAAIQKPMEQCIRYRITFYNDGKGVECASQESNQLCSRCRGVQKNRLVHSTAPFAEQTEKAKRQRTMRILNVLDRQTQLRDHLIAVKRTCSFCYVYTDPYTPAGHNFSACTCIQKEEFHLWRRKIRYKEGTKVCYLCHVPQGENDSLHPTFGKDPTRCEYRDVIAPAVYALLLQSEKRQQLETEFLGLDASTPMAALAWINSQAVQGRYTNLTALFEWFCSQYA